MYSQKIENFLNFLVEAQQEYNMAISDEKLANEETQDILHEVELNENSYHEYAKLSKLLRQVRRDRRLAKDRAQQLQAVVDWANDNPKTIKELERVLGATRKAEKGTEGRYYTLKTDVLSKINGGATNEIIP